MSRLPTAAASLAVVLAVAGALAACNDRSANVGPSPGGTPISLLPSCPTRTAIGSYDLDISGFAYCPAKITVPAGIDVAWTNQDRTPHTVTYDGPGGQMDSGSMAQGQRWASRFDQPGTYQYYCRFHPGMTGTIVVDVRA